jgi:integrase/recombinase XerC
MDNPLMRLTDTTQSQALYRAIESDISAAITDWTAWLRHEQHTASRTVSAYQRDLSAFLQYLANQAGYSVNLKVLTTLTLDDFNGYCAYCAEQGQAPASRARAVSTLRNFFRFLATQRLARNPYIEALATPKVPRPSGKPLSREKAWEAVEWVAQLSDAPWIARRDEAVFALLSGSGLRLGETLALNRAQAPRGISLTIVGSNGKQRSVPVLPFVPKLLADYLRLCPHPLDASSPLFVGLRGKRLNPGVVQRQLRRLRAFLGLPATVTPQTFRQCFAQRLCAEGGDLQAIQILLGHAHRTTTQRYVDPGK